MVTENLFQEYQAKLINLAYPYMFASEHYGKKAVITCTSGEYHQVGARMVADYFELNGCHDEVTRPINNFHLIQLYMILMKNKKTLRLH